MLKVEPKFKKATTKKQTHNRESKQGGSASRSKKQRHYKWGRGVSGILKSMARKVNQIKKKRNDINV